MITGDHKAEMLRKAEKVYAAALAHGEERLGKIIQHAIVQAVDHNNPAFLKAVSRLKRLPVTIDEFVESNDYLGEQMEVWPTLMPSIREMNPDQLIGEAPVTEIILGGATGWGKTACSHVTNAYQLYNLLCYDWPQEMFGLSRATPIVFMFAAVSSTVVNRVVYKPFREMFVNMKFTQKYIEYNRLLESSLSIGQNVMVVPALASVQSMVGQAVIGGILDEVNFMARVEGSKMIQGPNGQGGTYDQAELAYRNLSRRRKSRFVTRGPSPGAICVVSSTRYKGDFLDNRINEVLTYGEKGTVVFRHKQYDTQPQERFTGEKFRLIIGSDRWPTRLLDDSEVAGRHFPREAEVEHVPIEYISEFRKDPETSLRDILGVATDAIRPFISRRDAIAECIDSHKAKRVRMIFDRDEIVLAQEGLPPFRDGARIADKDAPRFIHIDLATTKDRCGVAMVRHDGFVTNNGERLPVFTTEMAVGIKPDSLHELQIADLREWLLDLIGRYELNVVQISFDGFQSKDSIQLLRRAGVRSNYVSVDRTPEPYEYLRQCIYDGRITLPDSELLKQELIQLEWLAHKGKVDHPPRGSKDITDALTGALFSASRHGMVRAGTRIVTGDGKPMRSRLNQQRPSAKDRPSSAKRPKALKDQVRDRDLDKIADSIDDTNPASYSQDTADETGSE